MTTSNLNNRSDKEIKKQGISFSLTSEKYNEAIFFELGLNMTTAINIFLRTTIRENGIPFNLKLEVPNNTTIAAIKEGRKIAKDPNVKGYHTVNELKKALDS